MGAFPDVVRDLTDFVKEDLPEMRTWLNKILQYNVSGGKRLRGLAVVYSFRMFGDPKDLTPENIRLSHILGWCVEMLQAFFIMTDDVMDKSLTRRGRPCWYKQPDVGFRAINDAVTIESCIYVLLRKHFADKPYYVKLIDLFHEITLKTEIGQTLDSIQEKKIDKFTMDRYNAIVKYKTAYYSFHLPVALAMHMAGVEDIEKHRQAKAILLEMGHFFQVQDDYMDVFGEEGVTGKAGTDIQDGKCTWLAVVALQRSTAEQRKILMDCYGHDDKEKVVAVRQLYLQLGLPAIFSAHEEETYNMITTMIQQLSRGMPDDLFFTLLHKIYKRVN
ncbi:hypothetical protein AAG570_008098 [Ranatra chinensis]|uniref:Farnesyl pyrophosphate synthase n=1 Tax=Ranatra chinensis TaxID=642074 RepID=A0ABD0YHN0_9HEMI